MLVILSRTIISILSIVAFLIGYQSGCDIIKCLNIAILPVGVLIVVDKVAIGKLQKREIELHSALDQAEMSDFKPWQRSMNNILKWKLVIFLALIGGNIGLIVGMRQSTEYTHLIFSYFSGVSTAGFLMLMAYIRIYRQDENDYESKQEAVWEHNAEEMLARKRESVKPEERVFTVDTSHLAETGKEKIDKRLKQISERKWDETLGLR